MALIRGQRSVFISFEPRHPVGSVQPQPGRRRAVQQPLAPGWLPASCHALCALGLRLWLWKGIPHPHLQDWVIPGSNKPLSAVARAPLPNPQPVRDYPMASAGGVGSR